MACAFAGFFSLFASEELIWGFFVCAYAYAYVFSFFFAERESSRIYIFCFWDFLRHFDEIARRILQQSSALPILLYLPYSFGNPSSLPHVYYKYYKVGK